MLGHCVHAHLHALLGQQLAYGFEHALIACVEGNGEVGRIHAVDYTVQFRIVESKRRCRVCLHALPILSPEPNRAPSPYRRELNRRLNRSKPESAYSVLQQGLFPR